MIILEFSLLSILSFPVAPITLYCKIFNDYISKRLLFILKFIFCYLYNNVIFTNHKLLTLNLTFTSQNLEDTISTSHNLVFILRLVFLTLCTFLTFCNSKKCYFCVNVISTNVISRNLIFTNYYHSLYIYSKIGIHKTFISKFSVYLEITFL